MEIDVQRQTGSLRGARLRISAAFWRRPWLRLLALIVPPVAAFVLVYAASLGAMLASSFWSTNAFTAQIIHTWSLSQFKEIFSWQDRTYLRIALRTVWMAGAVTITDAILAFPLAYFMARLAGPRLRSLLFVLVLLPLWSSYLVRIYSWTTILSTTGPLNWMLNGLGLPDTHLAYTNWAMWIVFSYVWLPFMILPVYTAVERVPTSYLEASADLGARGARTFRSVVLPLVFPGVVAGSIFTFSLTLGDYITPLLVGGPGSLLIGNVVFENSASNLAFAAAFAMVPVGVMAVYLTIARRLGAFEAL
ncbi:MAG TPA: ABC transporter permease [Gaiellaceae bacterium]|nr:ABC transporter permease [Gaiellaceae bacterium]